MRLKIKKFVALNYLIFGLCIALSWYHFIPTPHYITTTTDQLDNIKDNFQKKLDLSLDLKINHAQNYPKLLETYNTVIKSPLEEKNKALTKNNGASSNENANVILSVDCSSNAKENILEINSFSDFLYKGDCQELETSKTLQREVKRVMLSLTQGLIDDAQLNLGFEVIHININLIKSAKEKKGQSLDSLKKSIIEVAGIFFKKLGLPQSQYRLNFQTLFLEDLPLSPKTKNNSTFLEVKDLEHFVDTYPSISQEQIYSFETEDISWYIFTQKDMQFVDDDGTYTNFDEKNEKYAVMTASTQESDFRLLVLRTLYRAFELTTIQDLSNNLQNLKLKYQANFEFSLFNERRVKVLLKRIIHGLESFKYVVSDTELVIEKDVGEKIDSQLQQISTLALAENISIQELKDVYSVIWSLNYDGNNKFGHRDSFSDDYRIGVYIPLLLPFLFPILRTLKVLVKRNKTNV